MSYIIRLAKENDCNDLAKLKQQVWIETYSGIYSDSRIYDYNYEINSEKFLNIINNPNVELYVVEDNGKLVGYMDCGVPYRPYKDYKQEIGLLYLLKEYQRKGIGKELFNIGVNAIKKNGYNEFFVSCNKYNTNAQKFYIKMGGVIDEIDEKDDEFEKAYSQVKFIYRIKEDIPEILDIYDNFGNKTGRVVERGNKNEVFSDNEHIAVAIIYIENNDGDFLIQKTSKDKGSHYSSTGGHVVHGEDPLTTIKREVKEELGIDISNDNIISLGNICVDFPVRFIFYLKKDIDLRNLNIQKEEVESVSYMSVKKIKEVLDKGLMNKGHYVVLEKVLEYLEEK